MMACRKTYPGLLKTLTVASLAFIASLSYADAPTPSQAQSLIEQRQYDQARQELDQFLQEYPENASALFLLANVQIQQQQYDRAIETLGLLNEPEKSHPAVLNNLAIAYARNGKHKKAINLLQSALANDQKFSRIYSNVSELYTLLARQAYAKALDSNESQQTNTEASSLNLQLLSSLEQETPNIPDAQKEQPPTPNEPKVDIAKTQNDIRFTLNNWAESWSRQDVESYLSYYDEAFRTPAGVNRRNWEAFRKERIGEPRFIQVSIEELELLLSEDGKLAVARFMQSYRSDSYKERSHKQLVLKRGAQGWRIFSEHTE